MLENMGKENKLESKSNKYKISKATINLDANSLGKYNDSK